MIGKQLAFEEGAMEVRCACIETEGAMHCLQEESRGRRIEAARPEHEHEYLSARRVKLVCICVTIDLEYRRLEWAWRGSQDTAQ